MSKPTAVIYAPVETYSGYGASARDKVKLIHRLYKDEWDIKILSCGWGNTPMSFIDNHDEEWGWMKELFLTPPLNGQPDIMIWITVPNEAQPVGKWNCLFTAGIETNICAPGWIEGVNRMDLTIVSSNHSKVTFQNSMFQKKDKNSQAVTDIKLEKPVEVLFEGFNKEIYNTTNIDKDSNINSLLNNIEEEFAFLFTGMWLRGDFEKDRKNVSGLVKIFLETFKNSKKKPALILKTSGASASITDRNSLLDKINSIKKSIPSTNLPNIYIIHGDLSDTEMNTLYNHKKVKSMVCLTKGEGFGRPLLEFTQSKKPIIASGWGGHIDFLKHDSTSLIGGRLEKVHQSAVVKDMLIPESSWFQFDHSQARQALKEHFENYKKYQLQGKKLSFHCAQNFEQKNMEVKLKEIFDNHVKLPKKLIMPNLVKLD